MFEKVLPAKSRELIGKLAQTRPGREFYLAGGTAAALRLGHRLSEDLDSPPSGFEAADLENEIRLLGKLEIVNRGAENADRS